MRMRLHRVLVAAALLFGGLVVGFAGFAWQETTRRVLGAAEAEGRALLVSVAAGVEASLDASRAVDGLLADRLGVLAVVLDTELAGTRALGDETLQRFVAVHGLRGAALLNADLEVVHAIDAVRRGAPAPGDGPFAPRRLARLEAETLARKARDAGLGSRDRVVLGFGESPFGSRTEFLLGVRAREAGGYLLLRQDASTLERFEREAGVQRMLEAAAHGPGIAYVLVQGGDGRVLAAARAEDRDRLLPPPSDTATWRGEGGARVLDVTLPAPWEGAPEGHLRVGLAAGPVESSLAGAQRSLIVSTALLLVTGVGGLLLLGARERRAHRRQAALQRELAQRERFASLGRLAGGVAHEVRSPLNALSMASQRLRRALRDAGDEAQPLRTLESAIAANVARLDGTVEEFLSLGSQGGPPVFERLDLGALARETIAAEAPGARVAAPAEPLFVRADAALLAKALANVLRNAHAAAPGTVAVAWRCRGGNVEVVVSDRGAGIAEEDRERVFEPFFTGREGGTGLGLALARDAVERQHGTIRVGAGPEDGARFVISIPGGGAA